MFWGRGENVIMFFFRKVLLFVQIRALKVSGEGISTLKGTAYQGQTAWMP